MVKHWKSGGAEDKLIISLIGSGEITTETTARELKNSHPKIFDEFSETIIRCHLNMLRKMLLVIELEN